MKENQESKEDKKAEKLQGDGDKWKKRFVGMSVLSGILLIIIAVFATQPPKVEYIYEAYSSDTTSKNSSNSPTTSENLLSSSSSTDASNTTTYTSGEKTGTSTAGATIEVEQIIKHYQGYSSYYSSCEPESGYEYVLVKLSFKNNSANAIKMYSFDFHLKDSDGMMDTAKSNDRCYSSEMAIFPFSKEIAGGGTTVSGVMIFPVRKGMVDSLTLLYEKDTPKKRISIDL